LRPVKQKSWRWTVALSSSCVLASCRDLIPRLTARRAGNIVNIFLYYNNISRLHENSFKRNIQVTDTPFYITIISVGYMKTALKGTFRSQILLNDSMLL
jgi:hypothetical protein